MARPGGDGVGTGVRFAVKRVVTVGLAVGDRLQGGMGEARAQLTSLVAEARAEQQADRAASAARARETSGAVVLDVAAPETSSPPPDRGNGGSGAEDR